MGGFLMVRMLGFVRDRLCGSQSTDDEEAQDQCAGEQPLNRRVTHS